MEDKKLDEILLGLTQIREDQKRIIELLKQMRPSQYTTHVHPPIRVMIDDEHVKPKEGK